MQIPSRKERLALLSAALENGLTHFDTARMYGLGAAESELGICLRSVDRDSVTIGTKFGISASGAASRFSRFQAPARAVLRKFPAVRAAVKRRESHFATDRSYSPADASLSLDQSLAALDVDYIDIFFIHAPRAVDHIDTDGLLEFFERARQSGKIRAWGISQDEDADAGLARGFGDSCILQLRCDALAPPPSPPDIAFGILDRPHTSLTTALRADPSLHARWQEQLGADPLAPNVLADLLISSARDLTHSKSILYSTTKPHRIAQAAAAASKPLDPETYSRLKNLLEEFMRR
jgi:diketogulonate reductase-like aldo/keto reductase